MSISDAYRKQFLGAAASCPLRFDRKVVDRAMSIRESLMSSGSARAPLGWSVVKKGRAAGRTFGRRFVQPVPE